MLSVYSLFYSPTQMHN